ncbi:uncharacterized protein LOC135367276 [Ornithodoros turicata]|uniref:uncharacterized protein LOC135367276 n=1 Tax=Ornithodoros turicata TaxID=34597 RepID=UPI003138D833
MASKMLAFRTSSRSMSWPAKLQRLLDSFDFTRFSSSHQHCKPFIIGDQQVGLIRPNDWVHLSPYTEAFCHDGKTNSVYLNPSWTTYDERTAKLNAVLEDLKKKNVFKTLRGWRNECYEVSARFGDKSLMRIERAASCLFGIKRYGVHVNGYVVRPDGSVGLWFQRRSSTKETFPSKLDNMVSGGVTAGLAIKECVLKEAQEEASIPPHLLSSIKPAGMVSFMYEDERGIFPETLFVFDLPLPDDFQPKCSDNEVECFYLLTISEVKDKIVSEEFKVTSKPVVLDFLVRHHVLSPDEEPNYCSLMDTIHSPLHNLYSSDVPCPSTNGHHCTGTTSAVNVFKKHYIDRKSVLRYISIGLMVLSGYIMGRVSGLRSLFFGMFGVSV